MSVVLPNPGMMLFNRTIRALLPQLGREPVNVDNDDEYYKALMSRHEVYTKNNDTQKDSTFFSSGSTVAVQMEDEGPLTQGMIIEGNTKDH